MILLLSGLGNREAQYNTTDCLFGARLFINCRHVAGRRLITAAGLSLLRYLLGGKPRDC
jgi:hypothetical protein